MSAPFIGGFLQTYYRNNDVVKGTWLEKLAPSANELTSDTAALILLIYAILLFIFNCGPRVFIENRKF